MKEDDWMNDKEAEKIVCWEANPTWKIREIFTICRFYSNRDNI